MWRTAVRTTIDHGESGLRVEAAVLSADAPASVALHVRLASGQASELPMRTVGPSRASQVYEAVVPASLYGTDDFSYRVEAAFADGAVLSAPAGGGSQSVVVV